MNIVIDVLRALSELSPYAIIGMVILGLMAREHYRDRETFRFLRENNRLIERMVSDENDEEDDPGGADP